MDNQHQGIKYQLVMSLVNRCRTRSQSGFFQSRNSDNLREPGTQRDEMNTCLHQPGKSACATVGHPEVVGSS